MKRHGMFLVYTAAMLFSVFACHKQEIPERDTLSRFHNIVGPLPEVGNSTVQTNQIGGVVCEFTAMRDVILRWLYDWGNKRDHFNNVSYSDFHAKLLEIVSVRKNVVPYETAGELFDGVETALYQIRIVVSEVEGLEWRARIEVFQL